MLVFSTRIPAEMFEVGEKWACRTVDGHLVDKGLVLGQVKDNEFDMSGIFMKMTPVKKSRSLARAYTRIVTSKQL